jgi:hypothetical protein
LPKPRYSLAQAELTGAAAKNPQRYRKRKEPVSESEIGPPPHWLTAGEIAAWIELVAVLPWLDGTQRAIVALAARQSARLRAGTLDGAGMNLLRLVLGQLGATPADFRRVR